MFGFVTRTTMRKLYGIINVTISLLYSQTRDMGRGVLINWATSTCRSCGDAGWPASLASANVTATGIGTRLEFTKRT